MKVLCLWIILAGALAAGCSPSHSPVQPGLPADLLREDTGTITGSWQEIARNGRRVSDGNRLSIGYPHPYTFAVQKGCTATGGILVDLGDRAFRIQHYETGFSAAGCGPWRVSGKLAPFDGRQVRLTRRGLRLFAAADGIVVEFTRMTIR